MSVHNEDGKMKERRRTEYDLAAVQDANQLVPGGFVVVHFQQLCKRQRVIIKPLNQLNPTSK